jgi:hypothetical protein
MQGNTPPLLLHRVLLALLVSTLVLLVPLHAPTVTVAVILLRPVRPAAQIVLLVSIRLPLALRGVLHAPPDITRLLLGLSVVPLVLLVTTHLARPTRLAQLVHQELTPLLQQAHVLIVMLESMRQAVLQVLALIVLPVSTLRVLVQIVALLVLWVTTLHPPDQLVAQLALPASILLLPVLLLASVVLLVTTQSVPRTQLAQRVLVGSSLHQPLLRHAQLAVVARTL